MTTPSLEKLGLIHKTLALATHPTTDERTALVAMRRIPVILEGQGLTIANLTLASSTLVAALASSPAARNLEEIDRLKGVIKLRERAIDALRTRRRRIIRRGAAMRMEISALHIEIRELRENATKVIPTSVASPVSSPALLPSVAIPTSEEAIDRLEIDLDVPDANGVDPTMAKIAEAARIKAASDCTYPLQDFRDLGSAAWGSRNFRQGYLEATPSVSKKTLDKWYSKGEVPASAFDSAFFRTRHFYPYEEFKARCIELIGTERRWVSRYHAMVKDENSSNNISAWFQAKRVPTHAMDLLETLDWSCEPTDEKDVDETVVTENVTQSNTSPLEDVVHDASIEAGEEKTTVPYAELREEILRTSGNRADWRDAFCLATGYTRYEMMAWRHGAPAEAYAKIAAIDWSAFPVTEIMFSEFNDWLNAIYGGTVRECRKKFVQDAKGKYSRADIHKWSQIERAPIGVMEIFDQLTSKKAA